MAGALGGSPGKPAVTEFTQKADLLQSFIQAKGIDFDFSLAATSREQTVAGQFVRDVLDAADLSDDERMRVLVAGLRALAGRDDLRVD